MDFFKTAIKILGLCTIYFAVASYVMTLYTFFTNKGDVWNNFILIHGIVAIMCFVLILITVWSEEMVKQHDCGQKKW